jgi:uncharacterized membrane protein HdeD (DUF308 family)
MLETIRKHRTYYLCESIFFILLGILAIAMPLLFTISFTMVLGGLFLIAGTIQAFHVWHGGSQQKRFYLNLLWSVLALVSGIYLLAFPLDGALTLTMLLAIFFVLSGMLKCLIALTNKDLPRWRWLLVSGLLSIILGVLIWNQLPFSALWILGLFVGIDLIFWGITLFNIAWAIKKR